MGIAPVLTLTLVSVIAVLMLTTTLLDIRHQRAIFRDELEQRGLLMANTLNEVLADPLYFTDIDDLNDIARVVKSGPDIKYVQVFSSDGRLLVDTGQGSYPVGTVADELPPMVIQGRQTMFRPKDDILEIASPVQIGSEVIGVVQVGFSADSVEAKIRTITTQRIWQSFALILVGVVLSYGMAQYFVRPLSPNPPKDGV